MTDEHDDLTTEHHDDQGEPEEGQDGEEEAGESWRLGPDDDRPHPAIPIETWEAAKSGRLKAQMDERRAAEQSKKKALDESLDAIFANSPLRDLSPEELEAIRSTAHCEDRFSNQCTATRPYTEEEKALPSWRRALWTCDACLLKREARWREKDLRAARDTIPEWEWARFESNDGELVAKIAKADPKIAAAVFKWLPWKNGKTNLLLLGRTGFGKTTAAIALAKMMTDRGADPRSPDDVFKKARGLRFTKAKDLASAIRKHRLGQGEAPEIADAKAATLLILDDLGKEFDKDGIIPDVIDDMYSERVPMLVTSELTRQQLVDRYGAATARRLTDGAVIVEVQGG